MSKSSYSSSFITNSITMAHGVLIFAAALSLSLDATDTSCPPCQELLGVRVHLVTGHTLEGYMLTDPDGMESGTGTISRTSASFLLYENLRAVSVMDSEQTIIVATSPPRFITPGEVSRVSRHVGALEGVAIPGEFPVLSIELAGLLRHDPVASCSARTENGTVYWLSYNVQFRSDRLSFLCRQPWVYLVRWNRQMKINNLIRLQTASHDPDV